MTSKTKASSLWTGTTVVHPKHMYLKVTAHSTKEIPISYVYMKPAIAEALNNLYGDFGGSSLYYDFVHKNDKDGCVTLRTPVEHYQRIWAALTVMSSFNGRAIRFTITHATPFLFALDGPGQGAETP